jgi:hypothetical protein
MRFNGRKVTLITTMIFVGKVRRHAAFPNETRASTLFFEIILKKILFQKASSTRNLNLNFLKKTEQKCPFFEFDFLSNSRNETNNELKENNFNNEQSKYEQQFAFCWLCKLFKHCREWKRIVK